MEIKITGTPTQQRVDILYQNKMIADFINHTTDGKYHNNDVKTFSSSFLNRSKLIGTSLCFPNGADLYVSSPDSDFMRDFVLGLEKNYNNKATFIAGMKIDNIQVIDNTIDFEGVQKINTNFVSPIVVKNPLRRNGINYLTINDHSNEELTYAMKNLIIKKAQKLNIQISEFNIEFNTTYKNKKVKHYYYPNSNAKNNKVLILANSCPLIIEGDKDTYNFIKSVGVGNSTGIGFGKI